jgi:hypothetical protein
MAGTSDSVHVRNRCRLAVQIITTGNPEPHTDWAYEHVRLCGKEGAAAVAQAMLAAAAETDRAEWEKLTTPGFYVRDAGIFDAALRLSGNPAASTTARVYSMKVLVQSLSPGTTLTYDDLTRGPTARRVCFGTGPGSHHEVEEVSPLPSDYRERARAAMARLTEDPAQGFAIRQAARCVAVHARR